MVCLFADGTIDRVVIARKLLAFGTLFAFTGQFSTSADLDENELPSLIQHGLDPLRDVDDFAYGDDLIVAVHVTIVEFVKPKRVLLASIIVHVGDV